MFIRFCWGCARVFKIHNQEEYLRYAEHTKYCINRPGQGDVIRIIIKNASGVRRHGWHR